MEETKDCEQNMINLKTTPFAHSEDGKYCDVCGKQGNLWAMIWSLNGRNPTYLPEDAIAPYKINKEYRICYPCFFKSVGFKP